MASVYVSFNGNAFPFKTQNQLKKTVTEVRRRSRPRTWVGCPWCFKCIRVLTHAKEAGL